MSPISAEKIIEMKLYTIWLASLSQPTIIMETQLRANLLKLQAYIMSSSQSEN